MIYNNLKLYKVEYDKGEGLWAPFERTYFHVRI